MTNKNLPHHRRSIRLKGYDYSQAGAYFVTICTQNRACLFGNIVDGEMILNDAGRMVEKWYHELENKFPSMICDEFICMPNHTHFIIILVGADLCVRPNAMADLCVRPNVRPNAITTNKQERGAHPGAPLQEIAKWFKTMTTNAYIRGVKQHGWPPFPGKLWQRNYYEHIIRNEDALNRIREYIVNNPKQWQSDRENPNTSL